MNRFQSINYNLNSIKSQFNNTISGDEFPIHKSSHDASHPTPVKKPSSLSPIKSQFESPSKVSAIKAAPIHHTGTSLTGCSQQDLDLLRDYQDIKNSTLPPETVMMVYKTIGIIDSILA